MTDAAQWTGDVGGAWADEWRRTDRSFAELTAVLLARIAAIPASRVLDVGCGAGELSLAVARARPQAQVHGVDISPSLIAVAQDRAAGFGNLRFDLADAALGGDPAFAPELLVSRHGVMFFDDPVAAFTALAGCAAPAARLVFSCFRTPRENAWIGEIAAAMPETAPPPSADPYAPGPFAFADPEDVRAILAAAGWSDVAIEPVDFAYVAGEGADPVAEAVALFRRIGPAAPRLRALGEAERAETQERIAAVAAARRVGNRVAFPAAAWIVTATAASQAA